MSTVWKGPNMGKWVHYFDAYERHLQKFRNTSVVLLEIGLKNGGSLALWRNYFGSSARIFGADIYANSSIMQGNFFYGNPEHIVIGDQGEMTFWKDVENVLPNGTLDILIDDGSHLPSHMILSFKFAMKLLRPGGVYICEDVHTNNNKFLPHVFNILYSDNVRAPTLNSFSTRYRKTSKHQKYIFAITFYPYLVVVEKTIQIRPFLSNVERGRHMLSGSRHNWPNRYHMPHFKAVLNKK